MHCDGEKGVQNNGDLRSFGILKRKVIISSRGMLMIS